jgi:WD40 repeat protein
MIHSSAASSDGAAICLGDGVGWLAVYDVAALRAEPLSPPLHEARLRAGIAGAALTDDGGRLLTMCASGPVEVRDARAEGLPPLRALAFHGPQNASGMCLLHYAGDLVVAVGGGTESIGPGGESKRARVWRVSADGEEEVATLELTAFASAATVCGDGGQVAVGGADGAVRLFDGEGWAQSAELAEPSDGTLVQSLAYTPDGWRLVVGRRSQAFVVYDVRSSARGRRSSASRRRLATSAGWWPSPPPAMRRPWVA